MAGYGAVRYNIIGVICINYLQIWTLIYNVKRIIGYEILKNMVIGFGVYTPPLPVHIIDALPHPVC